MRPFELKPIGIIRSEHREPGKTPIQPVYCPECEGRVIVAPEYTEGLADIEGFSHIILLYWFDRAGPSALRVRPFLENREHGIFATRAPCRPNPIGFSVVTLLRREGGTLHVSGVDILDETPLLDIKPYSGRFDSVTQSRDGWQEGIGEDTARRLGRRGFDSSNALESAA